MVGNDRRAFLVFAAMIRYAKERSASVPYQRIARSHGYFFRDTDTENRQPERLPYKACNREAGFTHEIGCSPLLFRSGLGGRGFLCSRFRSRFFVRGLGSGGFFFRGFFRGGGSGLVSSGWFLAGGD